ncbi:hypothetical protein Drose_14050 [Dactylosporangium roseum]|uniref:Uncharacterized protein n=1 Tax=Dactylosporangium roseum TaxID=47989 RepID=A0ABY5ZE77_9ACTN|nr:hypothetical protein [Dactylosporangium roseum]UWZ39253.1 hypothetical protein Drose_14050 [Dactylosporangium roseum]
MRSISVSAAIVLLVVGIGDFIVAGTCRRRAATAQSVGELFGALEFDRDAHRVALVVVGTALVVVMVSMRRAPLWCLLLWGAFVVRVGFGYTLAPDSPGGEQALLDAAASPTAGMRREVLGQLDSIVPVAVDGLGLVLLVGAAAGHLFVFVLMWRVRESP